MIMKRRKLYITICVLFCSISLVFSGCSPKDINRVSGNTDSDEFTSFVELDQQSVDSDYEENDSSVVEKSPDGESSNRKYEGKSYCVLNDNMPEFTSKQKRKKKSFEKYSKLDQLGRCGVAFANIGIEIMPTEERQGIGHIKPSGWHTVKYNDLIDGNYLYNRCHLIGYQLAGENANERNLITGTRYLNVEGMLEFENTVATYVQETHNHVLYRVTPDFQKDNLVASGVQIEAWSVEDDGKGICFNVYCYNVQPGITIDYATGESWRKGETDSETEDGSGEKTDGSQEDNSEIYEFIININTKKFHLIDCSSVKDMAEHNMKKCTGTVKEVIQQGYRPCKRCIDK